MTFQPLAPPPPRQSSPLLPPPPHQPHSLVQPQLPPRRTSVPTYAVVPPARPPPPMPPPPPQRPLRTSSGSHLLRQPDAVEQRILQMIRMLPPDSAHSRFLSALLSRLPRRPDGSVDVSRTCNTLCVCVCGGGPMASWVRCEPLFNELTFCVAAGPLGSGNDKGHGKSIIVFVWLNMPRISVYARRGEGCRRRTMCVNCTHFLIVCY